MSQIQIDKQYIIGVDECGYGSWAGCLVIGAVRAPANWSHYGLKDSKKLSKGQRTQLANELLQLNKEGIIKFTLECATNTEIDADGLGACHKRCYANAIKNLYKTDDQVILDGNLKPILFVKYGLDIDLKNVRSEIKADNKFPTVMAASIIAKDYRDSLMMECHNVYPNYGWNKNVGYIVSEHRVAVKKYGLSPLHRKSYKVKL